MSLVCLQTSSFHTKLGNWDRIVAPSSSTGAAACRWGKMRKCRVRSLKSNRIWGVSVYRYSAAVKFWHRLSTAVAFGDGFTLRARETGLVFRFGAAEKCSLIDINSWINVTSNGTEPFSLPGQFAPRSESANRTRANSLPGPFAPYTVVECSLSRHKSHTCVEAVSRR